MSFVVSPERGLSATLACGCVAWSRTGRGRPGNRGCRVQRDRRTGSPWPDSDLVLKDGVDGLEFCRTVERERARVSPRATDSATGRRQLLRKYEEKAPPFRAGMNPTPSCHLLPYGSQPEFPRRETPSSTAPRLRRDFSRGDKSGVDSEPLRHVPAHGSDANGGTVRAGYPAVEGRNGSLSCRSARHVRDGRPLWHGYTR